MRVVREVIYDDDSAYNDDTLQFRWTSSDRRSYGPWQTVPIVSRSEADNADREEYP